MFYNDFILLFIEKYPQKYPLFFLLPPKKPSFKAITTRLRQDYGNCQQIEFTICLDNRVLSVGIKARLQQDYALDVYYPKIALSYLLPFSIF